MEIIEYNQRYAKAIADMWNRSGAVWEGREFNKTEKDIIAELTVLAPVNYYLAIEGEQVIGLSSLVHMSDDENGLEIELLTVDPDWHGKKIGKALVQRCVERTIELNKTRLYLFTWEGNEKAVPLYKKCGFFWEKAQAHNYTFLVNHIPYFMNNELIRPYLAEFDWYADYKRVLEIEPDGEDVNGFDIYRYEWEKADKKLIIECEKTGRGITKIDCCDFIVSTEMEEEIGILGNYKKKRIHLKNKGTKALSVSIKGLDSKGIKSSTEGQYAVEDSLSTEVEYYYSEVDLEFTAFKPEQSCDTMISINGKSVIFKTGQKIKYPLLVRLIDELPLHKANTDYVVKMSFLNNYKERARFTVTIPEYQNIIIQKNRFEIELDAEGACMVDFPIHVQEAVYYEPKLEIVAEREFSDPVKFERTCYLMLNTLTGKFNKKTSMATFTANGQLNNIHFTSIRNKNGSNVFLKGLDIYNYFHPFKLGKPYSDEFSHRDIEKAEYEEKGTTAIYKEYYESREIHNLRLVRITKLYAEGICEISYCIDDLGKNEKDVYLNFAQQVNSERVSFHVEEGIIQSKEHLTEGAIEEAESSILDENWLYMKDNGYNIGVTWPKEYAIEFEEGRIYYEINLSELVRKGQHESEPITLYFGKFDTAKHFREYLRGQVIRVERELDILDIRFKDRNPFVVDQLELIIKKNKKQALAGEFILQSRENAFNPQTMNLKKEDNQKELCIQAKSNKLCPLDVLSITMNFLDYQQEQKKVLFNTTKEAINVDINEINGWKNYVISNGSIQYSSCPEFIPGIYSLQYSGNEWFDSSFPTPRINTWYNPWYGGFSSFLPNKKADALLREETTAAIVTLYDNHGNKWTGIEYSTSFEADYDYKGYTLKQAYLTMPNIPIVLVLRDVTTDRKVETIFHVDSEMFLKFGDAFTEGIFAYREQDKNGCINLCRKSDYYRYWDELAVFGSSTRNEKLHILQPAKHMVYIRTGLNIVISRYYDNQPIYPARDNFFRPFYLLFDTEHLRKEDLHDLHFLTFERR